MRLFDTDNRYYKYYVETSFNKTDWELAVDHKNQESKSWQNLSFPERVTCFIRITGTSNLDGLDSVIVFFSHDFCQTCTFFLVFPYYLFRMSIGCNQNVSDN